jgi:hypothetical protein
LSHHVMTTNFSFEQWWRRPASSLMPGQVAEESGLALGLHELADETRDFFANAAQALVATRRNSRLGGLLGRKTRPSHSEGGYEVLSLDSSSGSNGFARGTV